MKKISCPLRILLGGVATFVLLAAAGTARAQTTSQDPAAGDTATGTPTCARTIIANVVALDQPFFWNRLGAVQPQGMIFALKRDVVPLNASLPLGAGNAKLRDGKRPRPLVLRMNVGDCLQINFENLLNTTPVDEEQTVTRLASVRVHGMQLVNSIASDGSFVGKNASSLVAPGGKATYTFYAEREGGYMLYSQGSTTGGEGDGGQLNAGLFGAVNVEVAGAEYYRSQVTAADLKYATTGTTKDGHPVINYNATYPTGHPRAGLPVLKMTQTTANGLEIVHTDLTAIITGANAGRFPTGTYKPNATEPDRDQPFREYTIIYHDEIGAVQAFPKFFNDPVLKHTLHSVRDAFAINYGTGGIGAEILANRLAVGPMANCTECKYEEFFLTSWAVGDPAMVVDNPANSGMKATKALYPDDPSNVYHSYIGDHVKMRVMHGGSKEHHIHHLHAHQWLHTPDSDNSSYLDSQAFGPGNSFTTEITYGGGGNRNQTVGDAIFHCHFYPHFAMGMWALWRNHDVFEAGTSLDASGAPAAGSRALPDAEIMAGTPIPAIVPLPTKPMAPLPEAKAEIVNGQVQVTGTGNPGFPFFVPAVAGHRPPTAPLDVIDDGGLPRHVITGGTFSEVHNRLDFSKNLLTATAVARPVDGTAVEKDAMRYHGVREHATCLPNGVCDPAIDSASLVSVKFITNGLPRKDANNPTGAQPGAPFADPCIDDKGNAVGVTRVYKAAGIQLDAKLNKVGWHFPQQRMLSLWGDVKDFQAGTKPPEPFFFRANTNDCITFYHTNLLPSVYELDDFQVRTPTDIIGQHIHLVKFDVTASDGAGNGWNYEDGTLAPDEVLERINAINATGGLYVPGATPDMVDKLVPLSPKPHPFFGTLGAQTTIQRWYVDNTLNNAGVDRTLRTVFTHDHFGPSTHQQVGLYAGLVVEPKDSKWRDPETGVFFGTNLNRPIDDGGPTSWRADIIMPTAADSYREFMLEFADFQHAYTAGGGVDAHGNPIPDPVAAINPPAKQEAPLPTNIQKRADCPGGVPLPCPEAISAAEPGTMVLNYRNEPVPLRIRNPFTNAQAAGDAGDLSHVFRSNVTREDPAMNVQPTFYHPLTNDVRDGDPFTPLLRAYEDDKVQIRILVGAHEEGHNFSVHGMKWLFEPSDENSGYRNSQMMGISEHFEFIIPTLTKNAIGTSDFLYQPGTSVGDTWNGLWGLVRAYNMTRQDLLTLPSNPNGHGPAIANVGDFNGQCPKTAPARNYEVTAALARDILPGGTLVYNKRTTTVKNPNTGEMHAGPLTDPTAILYVRSSDLDPVTGKLKSGIPIEPLILRANAGDCINVTLSNRLPSDMPDLAGWNTMPMLIEKFNANQIKPSNNVGLHPQLVFYDVTRSDGANVGFNPIQTARPGLKQTYQWYAGDISIDRTTGTATGVPYEFGATNLISSDPIKHSNKGAFGALIIEPQGAIWTEDAGARARATVKNSAGTVLFRDFVLMHQTDVNLRYADGAAVPSLAEKDDTEDTGQKAFNYRTEPLWFRMGHTPDTPMSKGDAVDQFGAGGVSTRDIDFSGVLSNAKVGGDPVTPIFTATAGAQARFRVLHAGGQQRNNVFVIHGHVWREEPYTNASKTIGANALSEWTGAAFGVGPSYHEDAVLRNGAGGRFKITGDYLYRTFQSFQFDNGLWGIFRVVPTASATDPTVMDPVQ